MNYICCCYVYFLRKLDYSQIFYICLFMKLLTLCLFVSLFINISTNTIIGKQQNKYMIGDSVFYLFLQLELDSSFCK